MAEEPRDADATRPAEGRRNLLVDLSNRIVGLHKEFYGRGPDKAKAYYYDDLVVVLMRGGYSRVEETLLQAGKGQSVIDQRASFQAAMGDTFKQAITEVTGREVIGFMSGNQQDPDMFCEVFVLAPSDIEGERPQETR